VCTLNATKVTNWITKVLGLDYNKASALALSASSSPDRPIMIPYLDGERTPNLPLASGVLSGLRTDTSAGELVRACFEGVLLNILSGLDALEHAGVDTSGRLIVTGGGAKSSAYVQFLADLSGRPVWVSHETDTAAKGAAVQAAAIFHGCPVQKIRDAWAPSLSIGAEPRNDQSVDELKERFVALAKQEELRATS
jgi:xylulokinase